MLTVLSIVAQAIFLLIVVAFVLYVLLELRVLRISKRAEEQKLSLLECGNDSPPAEYVWPIVTVFLPICNEAAVVVRLIDAACRLEYPGTLEILVLDDSTDKTSQLAMNTVLEYAALGHNIRFVARTSSRGYKAGNLRHGLRQATGQFYAIFDADFVPPPNFLSRTIPHFDDPKLGFLQTGIGYENRDATFLTRFQAMEMGHQQVVTVGLSEEGDMASLSGSSCIWRKACVDALGGWKISTVTEDVDLGYRAQLQDWKYAYVRDVVSMSILPETTEAFRVQRERWGRGLMHSAFKYARDLFRQRMPIMRRLHAVAMMFSSVLLASVYLLLLLCLPLNYLVDFDALGAPWIALVFFVFVAVWGISNVITARKGAHMQGRVGVLRTLWDTYIYVALFLPMGLYYFVGGVRALLGIYGEFHRTPKGQDEGRGGPPRIHGVLLAGDYVSFVVSCVIVIAAIEQKNYFLVPIGFTGVVGFGLMIQGWWRERRLA